MPWDSFGSKNVTKRQISCWQVLILSCGMKTAAYCVLEELVTDKNGEAVSSVLEIATFANGRAGKEKTYTLVETKAPAGYQKDDQEYKVRFAYEDDHTEVVKVRQKVQNVKESDHATPPKTGDGTPLGEWLLVLLLSAGIVAAGVGLTLRRKSWMQKRIE